MTVEALTRVLIVDDEPLHAKALSESLRAFGYDATSCSSAEAALAELRQSPFDLLLSDLVMPGMGGRAADQATRIDPESSNPDDRRGPSRRPSDERVHSASSRRSISAVFPLARAAGATAAPREPGAWPVIHELSQAIAYADQGELLDKIVDAAWHSSTGMASIMLVSSDGSSLFVASVRGGDRRNFLLGHGS
jgi:CheY-like chemotaxis protein